MWAIAQRRAISRSSSRSRRRLDRPRKRASRSLSATTTAVVSVSPVRAATSRARRSALGSFRLSATASLASRTLQISRRPARPEQSLHNLPPKTRVIPAGGYRYPYIRGSTSPPIRWRPSWAHELEHALEIGDDPHAVDEPSVDRLTSASGSREERSSAPAATIPERQCWPAVASCTSSSKAR